MKKTKKNVIKVGIWWFLIVGYYGTLGLFFSFAFFIATVMSLSGESVFSGYVFLAIAGYVGILYVSLFPFRQMKYSIKTNCSGYFWTGLLLFATQNILIILHLRGHWFVPESNTQVRQLFENLSWGVFVLSAVCILLFVYQKYIAKMHLKNIKSELSENH